MQKVAVCLSGVPRNWTKTLEYLQNYIIEPLSADLFIHIWNLDDPEDKDVNVNNILNVTYNYCNPKIICIENQDTVNDWPWLGLRMFYKTWRTDQLRQGFEECHKFKYDIVIKTREELEFFRKIDEIELCLVDDNTIIIPEGFDYYGINDHFAYSTSIGMSKYSNMFKGIDYWGQFDPEKYVLSWLQKQNLNIIRIPHLYKLRGQTTETLGASIQSRRWDIDKTSIC